MEGSLIKGAHFSSPDINHVGTGDGEPGDRLYSVSLIEQFATMLNLKFHRAL